MYLLCADEGLKAISARRLFIRPPPVIPERPKDGVGIVKGQAHKSPALIAGIVNASRQNSIGTVNCEVTHA
jgi:hypothetical protein